jgi:microcystin-dependent protein
MSEPFVAEIRIFAGNFAPRGWAFCDGTLLQIAQNTALFSLIGTIYGGDGRVTTALPDLRGRAPMHSGNGPGLTSRQIGQRGGTQTETLTESQMPNHSHTMNAVANPSTTFAPSATGSSMARSIGGAAYASTAPNVSLDGSPLAGAGGGGAHPNEQPFLAMNFIIALVGVYPSRS